MRLACPLHTAAQAHPEATALDGPAGPLSYAALDRLVTATVARLQAAGITPGQRVALYLPRTPRYVVLLLALWRHGGVACPLSTRLPSMALPPMLARVGATALLMRAEKGGPEDQGPTLPASGPRLDPQALVPTLTPPPASAVPPPAYLLAADQHATLVFTSGSTGTPKAALHSYGNHYYNALGSNANLPVRPGDRWLLSLPLYHVGGVAILFRCLLGRGTIVFPTAEAPLADDLARQHITHVSMVATQLRRLLAHDAEVRLPALDRLRAVLLGGSALPPALLQAALHRALPIHTTYGLTEMASQVTTTPPADRAARYQSAGRLLPHRALRLAQDGEVLVNGPTRFVGYATAEAIAQPFDAEGWFATGDLGRLDDDGYLYILGRKDNLFISGGENIQPEEIEAALGRLPEVAQALVVPVSDADFGHRPVAFVRLSDPQDDLDQKKYHLEEQLRTVLASFKIPIAFYPWPSGLAPPGLKVQRTAFLRLAGDLHNFSVKPD